MKNYVFYLNATAHNIPEGYHVNTENECIWSENGNLYASFTANDETEIDRCLDNCYFMMAEDNIVLDNGYAELVEAVAVEI